MDSSRHEKSRKENNLNATTFYDADMTANKSTSYHPEDLNASKIDKSMKNTTAHATKFPNKTVQDDAQSLESFGSFTLLKPQGTSSPIKVAEIPHKNVTERTPLKKGFAFPKVYADTRRGQDNKNSESFKRSENLQKIYYKTSIEKWRPVGDKKIHCPRCQAFKRPIVKVQKEKTTESSFLSAFMAACFPLYCSPCCVLPAPKFEYLHCPICDFHLGIYDHVKNIITSNPHVEQEL